MGLLTRLSALPLLLALLVGCAGPAQVARSVTTTTAPPPEARPTEAARSPCPVTLPNRSTPTADWGSTSHGNGTVYTELWPEGTVLADPSYVRPDGSIGMKWPWWRGVPGPLTVAGRRLDAPAPPLWAEVPDGYPVRGFQPSGLHFPTDGCWEVTGSVGDASLTFVTLVLKVGRSPWLPPATPTPAP